MASEARAGWRSIVKRRCRLAWIGGAPHVPGLDRGAGASLRCAAARPKRGQAEEPHCRGGSTGRPDEQVATDQRHPRSSTLAPSLALPCGHTDGSLAATIDLRARRCNGTSCPFQRCWSAATHQSSLHPGARDPATGRHLGRHAVVRINVEPGGSTPGLQIHSRQRSRRSPGLPDIDGFRPKPVAYCHAGASCCLESTSATMDRREGPSRRTHSGPWAKFRPNSRLNARSNGRLIGRRPPWGAPFGERQGRRTNTISLWWCRRGYRAAWLSNEADLTHGCRWIMADSSDPLGGCCQLTTGPYQGWMLSADNNLCPAASLASIRQGASHQSSHDRYRISSRRRSAPRSIQREEGAGEGGMVVISPSQRICEDSPEGSSIRVTERAGFGAQTTRPALPSVYP